MGKEDHPAFGGRKATGQSGLKPHILPSVFEDGVYFLHYSVKGKPAKKRLVGKKEAFIALYNAKKAEGI